MASTPRRITPAHPGLTTFSPPPVRAGFRRWTWETALTTVGSSIEVKVYGTEPSRRAAVRVQAASSDSLVQSYVKAYNEAAVRVADLATADLQARAVTRRLETITPAEREDLITALRHG